MTLRKKSVGIIALSILILTAFLYVYSATTWINTFNRIEEQDTRQDVQRVLYTLDNELVSLDKTADDWAAWDDTYEFIDDRNQEYIDTNLVDGTFTGLQLNLMLYIDKDGQIVFGRAFDLQDESEIDPPSDLMKYLTPPSPLLVTNEPGSGVTGIVLLDEVPMLFSSRPILSSNEEGPIRGTLLIGRNLDQQELEHISQLADVSLSAYLYNATTLPSDVQQALSNISADNIYAKILNQNTIAGYTLLMDVTGEPVSIIRVQSPRTIYTQAHKGILTLILAYLLFGIVSTVIILILLDRTILERLFGMVRQINEITTWGDASLRVQTTGKDELSSLAGSINEMLGSLELTQDQKEQTLLELEAQTELLSDSNHSLQVEVSRREQMEHTLTTWSKQQEKLIETAQNLAQSLDVQEVLERIGSGAKEILEADGCAIYLLEKDHTTLTPVVVADKYYKEEILATPLHIDHSFTGQAVKSRRALIFNDANSNDTGFEIPNIPEEEVEEKIIVAPFIVNDEVVGAMCLDRGSKDFTPQELNIAETFAAYAATVLKNARTHDQLQREVAERRHAEAALRESEVRYRNLFNRVPVGLYRTDLSGQFLDANQALAEMLGFDTPDSLKQHGVEEFIVVAEQREQERRMLNGDNTLHGYEMQLRRADGKIIWVNDTFRAEQDAQGKIINYEGSLIDITERKNAEEALQKSEVRYRTLVEELSLGIFRSTPGPKGTFLMANKAFLKLSGIESEEKLRHHSPAEFYLYPAERKAFSDELLKNGNLVGKELHLKNLDGKPFWGSVDGRVVRDAKQQPIYFDCTIQDITQRKQAEKVQRALYQISQATNETHNLEELFKRIHQIIQELLPAKNFYVALYDPISTIINFPYFADEHDPIPGPRKIDKSLTSYVIRKGKALLAVPDVFEDLVKNGEVDSVGTPSVDWLGVPLKTADKDTIGAMVVQTYDQGARYTESDKELMTIISSQVALAIDRKRAEEKLSYNAFHDELTCLPNRTLFIDRLGHAINLSQRRSDHWFAVLFLDLDRFKTVNDSLGHVLGDQLLVSTSRRLQVCLRTSDTIARFGGDEFVILLEDLDDTQDAIQIAERILEEIRSPFNLAGHEVVISTSIGIVFSSRVYDNPEEILRDADIAMYQAKALGRSRFVIFNTAMRTNVVAHIELENDLRAAIERKELELYYQPILSLKSTKIIGFEALVRWHHPEKGIILPGDFIPFAEESGLIIPMGEWILQEACRQMGAWHKQFLSDPPLTVSVNLSNKQFSQPDLIDQIETAISNSHFDARYLRLEITESVIMENSELAIATLNHLRQLGVQVYIDDFGTGYSSLVYLHLLPINAIKIDRSFISGNDIQKNGLDIAKSIVRLAHDLKLEAIAEGVETQEQLEKLKGLDCEYAQGYLISKCLNPKGVEDLLASAFSLQ
jgi:diguanylate cyclase (GGDEF)-like protein/PAS domain S-box-containing protein